MLQQQPGARRVLAKVHPISVLRFALVFWSSVLVIVLLAAALLWGVAGALGVLGGFSKFVRSMGFEGFRLHGLTIFRDALFVGTLLVVLATAVSVLMALLFNLITDVVGGLEVTVADQRRVAERRPLPWVRHGFRNEIRPEGRVSSARSGL